MNKFVVLVAVIIAVFIGVVISRAGEKEELSLKLEILAQEEDKINAQQAVFQLQIERNRSRIPALQKERADLLRQFKEMEDKERAAKEAQKKPVEGKKP